MKRNKIAKRLGIASLCLATALSAFSGIASQKNSVALADGEVAVTDFVHTTAGTVAKTTEKTNASGSSTATGLRFTSDTAYEGKFKTVFKGDTTLEFKFPEEFDTVNREYYGNFRIRIADVDDQSKFFDVVYYTATNGTNEDKPYTSVYLEHKTSEGDTLRRSNHYTNKLATPTNNDWYNTYKTNANYQIATPCFRSYEQTGDKGYALGKVTLDWTDDVLSVQRTAFKGDVGALAVFDGTYDSTVSTKGFVKKSTWGLPKMNFANGYTISFMSEIKNYYVKGVKSTTHVATDKGTDVFFTTISTNDGATTYNLSGSTVAVDAGMEQFNNTFWYGETPTTDAGKVFLGWKNSATNELYPADQFLRLSDDYTYNPVVIDYDVVTGASVRLVVGGQSGIRFQTMFNAEDYEAVKGYIKSFGTLLTYTDTLTTAGKDFTIENYSAESSFAQVANTKGLFDYTAKNGTAYKAYTLAVVDLAVEEYTLKYSARGYLVVTYVDGSTATIYTDYNVADNSRSIADVATRLKADTTAYEALSAEKKAIVDAYAGAQN